MNGFSSASHKKKSQNYIKNTKDIIMFQMNCALFFLHITQLIHITGPVFIHSEATVL